VLDDLPTSAANALERSVSAVRLPAGAVVFERGDAGNAMFLIRSGLVDVLSGGPDSDAVVTLGPGDVFGEQALLLGQPRTATVAARSDVVLWRLDHAEFLRLIVDNPDVRARVTRALADRLTTSLASSGTHRATVIVVYSRRRRVAARAARMLIEACSKLLGREPPTLVVGERVAWESARLGRDASVYGGDAFAGALARATRAHELVVVVCADAIPDPVLDRAPRILVVGDQTRALNGADRLVDERRVSDAPTRAEIEGVARAFCGRRVGLVLGSGGLRSFAHAGVLAVLQESGFPVDVVAGASGGAIAGALFLAGRDPRSLADLLEAARQTLRTGLPSFTLSPQALLSGRRLLTYLRNQLGADTLVEDLRVPFVVAATDLATREAFYIDHGPLADAVAASSAVPGIFRPVAVNGRRLVDGGVSDPVPVDAARALGADLVIAVNVMQVGKDSLGLYRSRLPLPLPSVVENLFIGLDTVATQIAAHACRTADVVVRPQEADPSWHDVVPAAAYMRRGEQAMTAALPAAWSLLQRTPAPSHSMVADGAAPAG
jgi:NTE family protein